MTEGANMGLSQYEQIKVSKILECSLEEATNEFLISVIYSLSTDLLKDDEDMFNIRDMLC